MDARAGLRLMTLTVLGLGCTRPTSELEAEAPTVAASAPDLDPDGDGVNTPHDLCPDEFGLPGDGCPLRDSDHDGVLDPDDACVEAPECVNGFDDDDGCPDGVPEDLAGIFGVIEGLEFEVDKSNIRPKSYARLDQVAEVMARYPELSFEIAGHIDASQNQQQLRRRRPTQRRAEAVRDYLVNKGIDPQRLVAVGYGEDMPIASNKTAEGRALNRRVEISPRLPKWVREGQCEPPAGEEAA